MSIGAYDAAEHERREQKASTVETSDQDDRTRYEGSIEYDTGDSAEALLDQFQEINAE